MYYLLFSEPKEEYKVVLLVRTQDLDKKALLKYYVTPIVESSQGALEPSDFIAMALDYQGTKAPVNAVIKPCLDVLQDYIKESKARHILVASSDYFKVLTGVKQVATVYGSASEAVYKGYEGIYTYLAPSYKSLFADPKNADKIELACNALSQSIQGNHDYFGSVIKYSYYPDSVIDIVASLDAIKDEPLLASDIEALSLSHVKAGISTISFAWNQHEGIAFNVALNSHPARTERVREVIKEFFIYRYENKLPIIWHGSNYDIRVIIFELFMERSLLNIKGLLYGLKVMSTYFHDTKLIAYLAVNSTARNELSLKNLAMPYLGDYGLNDEDFTDISKLKNSDVLLYNLKDSLGTFYVFNKYYKLMTEENQKDIYYELFLPAMRNILQMGLHGMPIDLVQVKVLKDMLIAEQTKLKNLLDTNLYGKLLNKIRRVSAFITKNKTWKTKSKPLSYFYDLDHKDLEVNYNSSTQISYLLYDFCKLPVLDLTKSKAPACGVKTLKKLQYHAYNQELKDFIGHLMDLSAVEKILNAFIPAFESAYVCPETHQAYLFASFNLGATVSGRLSCSNPNLQQIPSNSTYAKAVKKCFKAPKGKLFIGFDFNSLEDYVSALTTKDKNKLKVYIDGYDGHSLRAASYYPEDILAINPKFDFNTPQGVNTLKDETTYGLIRQDSKPCTFALTYQGTWHTLVSNLNLPEAKAKAIEKNFLTLYAESVEYINRRLEQASKDGYAEVAFGLKVRCPMLRKVVWNSKSMPYEAKKEMRTLGNAMGQSYGLLNSRAGAEFQEKTLNSPFAELIFPVMQIHDAMYFIIDDDLEVLSFLNIELIKSAKWQELPELQHDIVKIGGEIDLFYPDWSSKLTIPNGMGDTEELNKFIIQGLAEKGLL